MASLGTRLGDRGPRMSALSIRDLTIDIGRPLQGMSDQACSTTGIREAQRCWRWSGETPKAHECVALPWRI